MKKAGKFLAVALTALFAIPFAACSSRGTQGREEENIDGPDTEITGTLNIRFFEGGFGDVWLRSVVSGFNKKYPNVSVEIYPTTERLVLMAEIVGQNTDYDLYFSEIDLSGYTDKLMNLNDVYAYKWEGEEQSIGEKITPAVSSIYARNDGNYYNLPSYVGAYGMAYNVNYISEEDIPVTTDEMLELCDTLRGNNITPLIFSGGVNEKYYDFMYYQLYAQYEGLEAYNAAQDGQIINAQGEKVFDISSTYQQGALEAAQVLEDLLWYDNNNIVKTSTALNFADAQVQFLSDESAAMMFNGSWLMNEMAGFVDDETFSMFRIPVISAIRDKCTTVENDAELAALVDAIDAGSKALTGEGYEVNQADFDRVEEARNFCYLGSEGSNACIVDSDQINSGLAKLFLKYLYSDQGIRDFTYSQCGAVLPIDGIDCVEMIESETGNRLSAFYVSAYEMLSLNKFCNKQLAAIDMSCVDEQAQCFERQFGSQNAKDRTRAAVSFEARKTLYTANDGEEYWDALFEHGLITAEEHANKHVD